MEPARAAALRPKSVDDLLDGLVTVAVAVAERRLRSQGHHREAAGHQQLGALLRGEVVRRATA